jgi:hypothetical protein
MTKPGVIYLQKDKFQIFSPFLGSILEFRFLPTVIRDLDVINLDLLGSQMKDFVTNGKIPPGNMIIVLCDNAYFVKDFLYPNPAAQPTKPGQIAVIPPKVTLDDLKKQAELFVEHVPYDNVVSKTIPLKNGIRVCSVNQDLYGSLKLAFESMGFTIDTVLPGLVFGNNASARPVLDAAMASFILQKANTLKQYDLLSQSAFVPQSQEEVEAVEEDVVASSVSQDKKPSKKRLIALGGVFASLVVVLIIVYVQSQAPTTPPQQPALAQGTQPAAQQPAAVNTQPTVAPTQATVIDATQTQNLNVQIVNASNSATFGQSLKLGLSKYTFKSVTMQTQSNIGTASTVVSFAASVTQPVRNAILDEVRKVKNDIIIQEKQDGGSDVSIILGK